MHRKRAKSVKVDNIDIPKSFDRLLHCIYERGLLSKEDLASPFGQKRSKNSGSKRRTKNISGFVISFLLLPSTKKSSWIEVFYTRLMLQRRPITFVQAEAIRKFIPMVYQEYAEEMSQLESLSTSKEELLEYLASHSTDVDNSLLGLRVSKTYEELYESNRLNQSVAFHVEAIKQTKEELLEEISTWNTCKDDKELCRNVKSFLEGLKVQSCRHIKKGELVLVNAKVPRLQCYELLKRECFASLKYSENEELHQFIGSIKEYEYNDKQEAHVIIGRVKNYSPQENVVEVYIDPIEVVYIKTTVEELYLFTYDMKEMIRSATKAKGVIIYQLLRDNYKITSLVAKLVSKMMEFNNVSEEFLQHLRSGNVTPFDSFAIAAAQTSFATMLQNEDHLFPSIVDIVNNAKKRRLGTRFLLYHSTEGIDLDAEKKTAMNVLTIHHDHCSVMLEEVDKFLNRIFDGTRGRKMQEWCAMLSQNATQQFFKDLGFQFPDDTTNAFLDSVTRSNNNKILDNFHPEDLQKKVLQPLTNTIRPECERFKHDLLIALLHFSFSSCKNPLLFDEDLYRKELRGAVKKGILHSATETQIQNALLDLNGQYTTFLDAKQNGNVMDWKSIDELVKLEIKNLYHLSSALSSNSRDFTQSNPAVVKRSVRRNAPFSKFRRKASFNSSENDAVSHSNRISKVPSTSISAWEAEWYFHQKPIYSHPNYNLNEEIAAFATENIGENEDLFVFEVSDSSARQEELIDDNVIWT